MLEEPKKILVVEDDADLSLLLTSRLEDEGFEPILAETGRQALDRLAQGKFDLILLDIILPDIDGLTILNELKSSPGKEDIPVIILSNLEGQETTEQVKSIGQYEYLVKAKTDLDDVIDKVKRKLGSK